MWAFDPRVVVLIDDGQIAYDGVDHTVFFTLHGRKNEEMKKGTKKLNTAIFQNKKEMGERVDAHLPEYSTLKSFGISSPKRFEPKCSSAVVEKWTKMGKIFSVSEADLTPAGK